MKYLTDIMLGLVVISLVLAILQKFVYMIIILHILLGMNIIKDGIEEKPSEEIKDQTIKNENNLPN